MWDIILIHIWNDEIGWEHWGSVGVVHTACKGACIWHNVKMQFLALVFHSECAELKFFTTNLKII